MTKQELTKELLKHRYAHRGLHAKPEVPENSMMAFKRAVDEGFGMELDVHITADGKLAVIHDASLKRTCGVDLIIEHITLKEAQIYLLEKSQEKIPEFKDVLKLVDGKTPLIIELKVGKYADGSPTYVDLCKAIWKELEGYSGMYCIESFDPSPVKWFRENHPEIVRGQLASDLNKEKKDQPWIINFLMKTLLVIFISKPDFVAYDVRDKHLLKGQWKGPLFYWTVKEWEEMKDAESKGIACIFEDYNPKDYE